MMVFPEINQKDFPPPPPALLVLINFHDFQFVTFLYQFEPVLKNLLDSDNHN